MNHLRRRRPAARRGFTLIELLIVIAIIGILVGMITAAVVQALKKGRETQNRVDISQLDLAVEQFKQKFGQYPPSRIKLCENLAYYDLLTNGSGQPNNQLDTDSVQFLSSMFPQIINSTNLAASVWVTPGIDWNGNGAIDGPPPVAGCDGPGAITLEGDQCLVFFLGGIPNLPGAGTPTCLGFSSFPRNPAFTTTDRIGPFFDFQSSRLVLLRYAANNFNTYYSYADNYSSTDGAGTLLSGAPYAYFSSYKKPNNYNRYRDPAYVQPVYPAPGIAIPFAYSDCVSMGLDPYFESQTALGNKYLKPNSFQIISAGRDNFFGAGGGPWNGATGATFYVAGTPGGYDDQSNFTGGLIGTGPSN